MSNDLNMVSLTGHLCQDPELKYIGSEGTAVCNFSIANNVYKPSAEDKTYANFFNVAIFGKRAEALSKYLRKGLLVAVHGRLQQDRWETTEGNKRNAIKIIANELKMMSGGSGSSGGGSGSSYKNGNTNGISDPDPSYDSEIADLVNDQPGEDDVPF